MLVPLLQEDRAQRRTEGQRVQRRKNGRDGDRQRKLAEEQTEMPEMNTHGRKTQESTSPMAITGAETSP